MTNDEMVMFWTREEPEHVKVFDMLGPWVTLWLGAVASCFGYAAYQLVKFFGLVDWGGELVPAREPLRSGKVRVVVGSGPKHRIALWEPEPLRIGSHVLGAKVEGLDPIEGAKRIVKQTARKRTVVLTTAADRIEATVDRWWAELCAEVYGVPA